MGQAHETHQTDIESESAVRPERSVAPSSHWARWPLLIVALGFFLGSLLYQAWTPARQSRQQSSTTIKLKGDPDNLILTVVYPRVVPLESPSKSGLPLSIYLGPVNDAQALASARAVTLTLLFVPQAGGLVFTDGKGMPVAPELTLDIRKQTDKPAGFYLHHTRVETSRISAPIEIWFLDPNKKQTNQRPVKTLPVVLEAKCEALWRHFCDLLLGPTTPLLALVASMIGFAWQWWQAEQERKWTAQQKERRTRDECISEIEHVRALGLQDRLREAVRTLIDVTNQAEHVWESELELVERVANVREALEEYPYRKRLYHEGLGDLCKEQWDQADEAAKLLLWMDPGLSLTKDLRHVTGMLRSFAQDMGKWVSSFNEIGPEEAVAVLLRIHSDCDDRLKPLLIDLLANLAGRAQYVQSLASHMQHHLPSRHLLRLSQFEGPLQKLMADRSIESDARDAASKLLSMRQYPSEWPPMWPMTERPPDPPAVAKWLDKAGLLFNPFGPEQAQEDPLLPELWVQPPGWQHIKAPTPAIAFGADGSGKTAAMLLLEEMCHKASVTLTNRTRDLDTFPVRFNPLLEAPVNSARQIHLDTLSLAIARAILDFLARNPHTYGNTTHRQRTAVARLLSLHQERLGNASEYLQGAGLERRLAERLAGEITQATPSRPKGVTKLDEAEMLLLLADARLHHFRQYYLLTDISCESLKLFEPKDLATQIRPLLALARPLATVNIHLKVALPHDLEEHIRDAPGLECVSLTWTKAGLTKLLNTRLKAAGVESLLALCDSSVRRTPSPAERLIQAAEGLPGNLIRKGNDLLEKACESPGKKPKLTEVVFQSVLGPPPEVPA